MGDRRDRYRDRDDRGRRDRYREREERDRRRRDDDDRYDDREARSYRDKDRDRRKKKPSKLKTKKRKTAGPLLSFGDEEDESSKSFKVKKASGLVSFVKSESRMTEEEALLGPQDKKEGEEADQKEGEPEDEEPPKPAPTPASEATPDDDYKKYMTYFKKPKKPEEEEKEEDEDEGKSEDQKPVKILVTGDVRGRFRRVFTQASKFQDKAGPFAALLCVGDFFAKDGSIEELQPYLDGEKKIPMPTYLVAGEETGEATRLLSADEHGANAPKPLDPLKLAANLTYLGRQGLINIGGLSVGYLSGRFHPQHFPDPPDKTEIYRPYKSWYCDDHLDDLLDNTGGGPDPLPASSPLRFGVDVLLTSEWPAFADIAKQPPPALPEALKSDPARVETLGSPAVGALVSGIATRYHFAGTEDVYYAMPPFRNKCHATRFYALGGCGNPHKEKSIKAFSIVPLAKMTTAQREKLREGAGPSPFSTEEAPAGDAPKVAGPQPAPAPKGPTVAAAPTGMNATVFHNGLCKTHTILEDGRWKCAFCGNVNYARQNKHCNMRKCQAPAPPSLRPVEAKPGPTMEGEDEEKAKQAKKRSKRESIYYAQRPKKRRGPKNE